MTPVQKNRQVARRAGSTLLSVALLSVTLLLSACGGGVAGDDSGEGVSFSFAMGSSGAQGAFYQEAVNRVNEKHGYKGKWVELTGSEVAVSGISSNKFQFGAGVAATVMTAQQKQDAPLTFIGDYMKMLWTLTGRTEYQSCENLNGKRFGLHSPGGVSTAIFKAWKEQNCPPNVKPKILYIEGSPNRLQGLLADQLDATMLEIDDTLELPKDRFHIVVNFSKELRQIQTNTVYANNTYLRENREVAVNLLAEASALAKEINADPSVLAKAIKKYKPELSERADAIAKAYVEGGIFVEDGAIPEKDIKATIALYELAGAIKPGLTYDKIADPTYLEEALQRG